MKQLKPIMAMLMVATLMFLTGCGATSTNTPSSNEAAKSDKLKVVTTIFPEYDFAKNIGKDHVEARILIPPGSEAHHYEPTPKDLIDLKTADVFIYTSLDMEPWVEKILKQLGPDTVIIESGKGIKMYTAEEMGIPEENAHEADEDAHEHEGHDPHIWLDPSNAIEMVENIKAGFVEKAPSLKNEFESNAKDYQAKLSDLDQNFFKELKTFSDKKMVFAGHFAFGYMAKKYDIKIFSPYEGFSPDAEPSAQKIAQMIDLMKKENIKTVYYEELIDPKIARIMASETKADLVMLHAAHNVSKEELEKEVTYLDIMNADLEKLVKGFRVK